jgi:hypothetical protein
VLTTPGPRRKEITEYYIINNLTYFNPCQTLGPYHQIVQGKEDINMQHFGGKTLKKRLPGKPEQSETFMISGFCCNVDENCALLGCYTVCSSNSLPMYWDNLLARS